MNDEVHKPLEMWTVYKHPRDFPNGYLARLWIAAGDGSLIATVRTITANELAPIRRALAQKGLYCLHRSPGDEPQIVETWL